MEKLQQNLRSAMEELIEMVNAMRSEIGDYVPEKKAEFGQLMNESGYLRNGNWVKETFLSVVRFLCIAVYIIKQMQFAKQKKSEELENNELDESLKVHNENTEEVTSTIAIISAEVAELKEKMEEFLKMLEKSQNNMEDAGTEQEVEIRRMKMENEKLKRENWSLNESLKRLKIEEKIEYAENSTKNQYHDRLLRFQNARVCSRPQMNKFSLLYENESFAPDFTWKINGIQGLLEQDTFHIESEEFSWNEYPDVRVRATLELRSNDWLYVSLSVGPKKIRNPRNFKLCPIVYFVLKDRSGNEEPEHIIEPTTGLCSFFYLAEEMVPIDHKSGLAHPSYNVADCVVLEVYVEPPEEAQRVHSTDGTLNWTVDNCWKRYKAELKLLIYRHQSPYFYTGPEGYRVQVWLWLNGIADYLGLSVEIVFLAGEFDKDLPRRFPHRTTVTVVNQKNPERSIIKTVEKMTGDRYYFINVFSFEEIHVKGLLENDTLYFNFTIIKLNE